MEVVKGQGDSWDDGALLVDKVEVSYSAMIEPVQPSPIA
jgi:hypothetical protein